MCVCVCVGVGVRVCVCVCVCVCGWVGGWVGVVSNLIRLLGSDLKSLAATNTLAYSCRFFSKEEKSFKTLATDCLPKRSPGELDRLHVFGLEGHGQPGHSV